MSVEKILIDVVAKAINSPFITLHAKLRFIERNYKIDVEKIRHEICRPINVNARTSKNLPSDYELIETLERSYRHIIENMFEDILYYVEGKTESFNQDDLYFLIEDDKLITVMEDK